MMQHAFACLLLVLTALTWADRPAGATGLEPGTQIVTAQVDPKKLLVQPRAEPPANRGWWARLTTYIRYQQQNFYRQLATAIKQVKAEGSLAAAWTLVLLSFLYGVFHAAGPGHGKAVISAYLLADERLLRRGVLLAFFASLMQAVTAIALVTIVVLIISAAGRTATSMVTYLESASYALISIIGLYMLWAALRGGHAHAHAGDGHVHDSHAGHDHSHHDHAHHDHAHHDHADHEHGHCDVCGHVHIPEPRQLDDGWSLKKGASIAFAVGIRPCSGAVLVLLFANSLGLYLAGIGATFAMSLGTFITVSTIAVLTVLFKNAATSWIGPDSVWAGRVFRALAVIGALAIIALGLILLTGSLTADRPLI